MERRREGKVVFFIIKNEEMFRGENYPLNPSLNLRPWVEHSSSLTRSS